MPLKITEDELEDEISFGTKISEIDLQDEISDFSQPGQAGQPDIAGLAQAEEADRDITPEPLESRVSSPGIPEEEPSFLDKTADVIDRGTKAVGQQFVKGLEKNARITELMTKKDPTESEQQEIMDFAMGFQTMGVDVAGKNLINSFFTKIKPKGKGGIPTTVAEDIGSKRGQKLDVFGEDVPFSGMARFRKKQLQAADDEAKGFLGRYIKGSVDDIDFTDPISQARQRAVNDKYIDNLYEQMKASARTGLETPAVKTKEAATELIERYPDVFKSVQDKKTQRILKNIIGDTDDVTMKMSKMVDEHGLPYTYKITPEFDFDSLWQLRKGLGTAADNATTKEARSVLMKAKHAVSADMETLFAAGDSAASKLFKNANDAFKRYDVKHKQVQEAYDWAIGAKGAGEAGRFNPAKFSTRLKNLAHKEAGKGKFSVWTDAEITEMTNLSHILHTVKRAGEYGANPETGARAVSLALLAHSVKSPIIPIGWANTFLTTTKTGKNILKSIGGVQTDSKKMRAALLTLYDHYKVNEQSEFPGGS